MGLELAILVVAVVFAATIVAVVVEHVARALDRLVDAVQLPVDERAPRRGVGQLYGRDREGRGRP